MSTDIDALHDHLDGLADAFYPGGGSGSPDPTICRAAQLGVIFESLARTHQLCVSAAQTINQRHATDHAAGGIIGLIADDCRIDALAAVSAAWAGAAAVYVQAVRAAK